MTTLQAPFPWFGGKRRVASEVWARFGDVKNYVEPFFGSGAVLLGRPRPFRGVEAVNDLDGFVANFWRAVRLSPKATAEWAGNPVNENDLHARHVWLLKRRDDLRARLEGDPEFHDPQIAGWWAWGVSSWFGSPFCSGDGPWWTDGDGMLTKEAGRSIGVCRQRPRLGNNGQGVNRPSVDLPGWFGLLSERLRFVRVCSGDWSRVCVPSVTHTHGLTGVFLDPPYADTAGRAGGLYAHDSLTIAHAVREWAIEAGKRPDMRIALCGYEGEHEMPDDWAVHAWKAQGSFGGQAKNPTGNSKRERIWFSPACLSASVGLLAGVGP